MLNKIKSTEELKSIVDRLKNAGRRIGFTNGCFDILHAGHVLYLAKARQLVDVLIVGLNSDSSIKQIKGPNRPINNQNDRAIVLAALESIDYIAIFDEPTPIRLIKTTTPDILFKGADWKGKTVVGADFVIENGGKVEFIDYLEGRSTTNMIERIVDVYCDCR
ncbi:D-glycero-beta-D-manno-heptose 1-phosphate adenylyltransferase [Hippea jasoniae]|uniref:D-glycero-beta-D-manno-heptose 1-phosphate adenylyltransferase n=1 Tax=Hippea jasoniae TaxID=944479 RepID=UPI00054E5B67|nr:D-glycero-beta-D-manno-heptose 1-phosphate adenylyltransferase [Hippea jasoniae]